jgi:hypothetical protein
MHGRLYLQNTLLEWFSPDLQDVAAELRPFIEEEDAVVRPRHVARDRPAASADQPHVRDGVVGARKGRVVMRPGRLMKRPTTWRMGVSPRASASSSSAG